MPTIIYLYQKIRHNKKQTRIGWLVDEDSNKGIAFFIYPEKDIYVTGKVVPAEKYLKEIKTSLKQLGISTNEQDIQEYILGENKVVALKNVHIALNHISKKKIPVLSHNAILDEIKILEIAETLSQESISATLPESPPENPDIMTEEKISQPSVLDSASAKDLKLIFSEIIKRFSHWEVPKTHTATNPAPSILSKEQILILFTINDNPRTLNLLFKKLKISNYSKLRTLVWDQIVAVACSNTSFPYALNDLFIEMLFKKLDAIFNKHNLSENVDPKCVFEAIDLATVEWKEFITHKTITLANVSGFFAPSQLGDSKSKLEASINWHNQIRYLPQIIEQTKNKVEKINESHHPISTSRIPITSTLFKKKPPHQAHENPEVRRIRNSSNLAT